MANIVIVGKRVIPREHIALVEPYDPAANPRVQTSRDLHGRVVLINRDSILIEELPQTFAAEHGFRMLAADRVATNPAVQFRVESFLPAEGFAPTKAFASRLIWRDFDGNDQSKLLLSEPETVLSVTVQGHADPSQSTLPQAGRGHDRRRVKSVKETVSPQ